MRNKIDNNKSIRIFFLEDLSLRFEVILYNIISRLLAKKDSLKDALNALNKILSAERRILYLIRFIILSRDIFNANIFIIK